jgi:hypothetical protein
MSVIRIEEIARADGSVEIKVDGVLNRKSLILLDQVCRLYLNNERNIVLNLNGIRHITREGRNYLMRIQNVISFKESPCFLKFSIIGSS